MKTTLVYDIASCPMSAGMNMEDVIGIYNEHNLVVYDSRETEGCKKPEVMNLPMGTEVEIMDLATAKGQKFLNTMRRE